MVTIDNIIKFVYSWREIKGLSLTNYLDDAN